MEMTSYQSGIPSWVDLSVPDPDAAADFYGSLFDWQVPEGVPEAGGYRIAEVRGLPVAGIGSQMQQGMPPVWTTYIATDDVDATAKLVTESGGQTFAPPMDVMDAGRMAVFADPTGAVVSAWQAGTHKGAGLVNEPVSLSWNELATRDPEAAIAFYRAVFGWDANTMEMGASSYTEWLLDGKSIGGMMPMDESFPAEVPAHWRVYFAVADADATVAKATQLGGTVFMEPMDIPQGRFAALGDPQGAMFNVIALSS